MENEVKKKYGGTVNITEPTFYWEPPKDLCPTCDQPIGGLISAGDGVYFKNNLFCSRQGCPAMLVNEKWTCTAKGCSVPRPADSAEGSHE